MNIDNKKTYDNINESLKQVYAEMVHDGNTSRTFSDAEAWKTEVRRKYPDAQFVDGPGPTVGRYEIISITAWDKGDNTNPNDTNRQIVGEFDVKKRSGYVK